MTKIKENRLVRLDCVCLNRSYLFIFIRGYMDPFLSEVQQNLVRCSENPVRNQDSDLNWSNPRLSEVARWTIWSADRPDYYSGRLCSTTVTKLGVQHMPYILVEITNQKHLYHQCLSRNDKFYKLSCSRNKNIARCKSLTLSFNSNSIVI